MNKERTLEKFYTQLREVFILKYKKLSENSLLLSFLDIKKNDRFRILQEGSVKSQFMLPTIRLELLNKQLIQESDNPEKMCITGKGIWEYEKNNEIINEITLISFLDNKIFNVFQETSVSLSEKQKVIILSLISARAFSETSCADLKKSEKSNESWMQIVKESYRFLSKRNIILKLKEEELYGKKGNEHPVSNLFRHTDQLPRLTKGIWKALGNQKYYLDIIIKDSIKEKDFLFLIKKVIEPKKFSFSEISQLENFLRNIAHTQDILLFDSSHKFSSSKYDAELKNILLNI